MKEYNVIFAGTVRDVEKYIKKGLDDIDRCGRKFNEYAVIIYENDSKDATRMILEQKKQANYHYIFEDNVKESRRTVRLANGRNKIMDKVRELNRDGDYQYLILLDIDDINESGTFVDSIETCFEYENWDVFTGNQPIEYYDLWALRKKYDMEYDCWDKVRRQSDDPDAEHKYVDSKLKVYSPGELLEVDSAFGGIAIYRLDSIPKNCKYVGADLMGNETCEHVEFHRCIKQGGGAIYINTSFLTSEWR